MVSVKALRRLEDWTRRNRAGQTAYMDNLATKPLQPKAREKWGELFQVSQQEHLSTTMTPFLS